MVNLWKNIVKGLFDSLIPWYLCKIWDKFSCMSLFPKKMSFMFQNFISICSRGALEDNDRNKKNKGWWISGKMTSKVSFILSDHNTYVKYERYFCIWKFSQQNPLLVFTTSPTTAWEACRMRMTKTRKKKILFSKFG